MHERENALKEWLKEVILTTDFVLTPLTGDASFRRYFRLHYQDMSRIVMDAPPAKEELGPFIYITQLLQQLNINAPQLFASDLKNGFLLLSDLGDNLLLSELNHLTVNTYYQQAIDIIGTLQEYPINSLQAPLFDATFMLKEMQLCNEWFFSAYLQLTLSDNEHDLINKSMLWLANSIATQPSVFIHRDYHARNLMITQDASLAVIDYQDAMIGPLTYDLVSLLKDCYISWPREQVLEWLHYYYNNNPLASAHYTFVEFVRAVDLCGLQRHIKVLGVFSRLHLRDGKSGYLTDLPLTLKYVLECAELYPELHALYDLLQNKVRLP